MSQRIFNFNAGPATLPLSVIKEIQSELDNYKGCGMSVMEISHRSKWFDDIINDAILRIKRLLNIKDEHEVLFIQGGASMQFAMIPMNFLKDGETADYINTGTWSTKAFKEALIQGKKVVEAASSEDRNFSYIPKKLNLKANSTYVHITSNNTIKGTQWSGFPDTNGVPIISDMSSDIFSRYFDIDKFGLVYAGAQKNMGPAGVTVAIIRKDMLKKIPGNLPSMLKYTTYAETNSMYNTPPCFAIYVVQLVMKWIEETIGGLSKMEELNRKKAAILYDFIDNNALYRGTADIDSRSLMNITFRLSSEELEKKFITDATENGLGGLKGHRSVGGCRASIYNAMPIEGIERLVEFMSDFARKNG